MIHKGWIRRIGLWTVVTLSWAGVAADEEPPEVPLSLHEALETALQRNLDLLAVRKNPEIAREDVEAAKADFDPVLGVTPTTRKSVDEPFNPSNVNRSESLATSTSLSHRLGFGADYSINFSSSRFDASAPLFTIDSAYSSDLALNFNLPLLQGRGREVTQQSLILARSGLETSREDLRRQVETTLEQVEGAYWDLVSSRQALQVARQSLARAQDLLELNRKKVEVGTLAPIEITQAEAGVASQEEGVIVAEVNLANAEDELRRLMGIPPDDPLWDRPLVPTDEPTFQRVPVDAEEVLDRALERRPEIINARRTIQDRDLGVRVARRSVRHRLDLHLDVTPSGNNFVRDPGPDGIPNTFDDRSVVEGGLGEALSETPKFRNYSWTASLNYTFPIGNRAAKAGYRRALLQREQASVQLRSLEQQIRVEVRAAVRAVESGLKRVEAARANVVLQKKKLEAERKKFENGMSTSFAVLEFQTDLAEAELAEIRALIDYNKALAGLERVQGRLLEARGFRLEFSGDDLGR